MEDAKFLSGNTHSVSDETRKRFEPDARITQTRQEFDRRIASGEEIPLSPFAQRIAAS